MDYKNRRAARTAALGPDKRALTLGLLGGHLYRWSTLVELQAQRVRQQPFGDAQGEMLLFAMSLRELLRCADLATDLGVPTADLFREFDQVAREAKDVRDVLSHFDDYELGMGRLQKPGEATFGLMYGRHPTTGADGTLYVMGVDIELPVDAAATAGLRFAEALLDRLSTQG